MNRLALFLGSFVIGLAFILGCFFAAHRLDFEAHQSSLEVAIPFKDVQRLGASDFPAGVLNRLKTETGFTSIIVDESTLEDWTNSARAVLLTPDQLVSLGSDKPLNARHVFIRLSESDHQQCLSILKQYPAYSVTERPGHILEIAAEWDDIKQLGLGFDQQLIHTLKQSGWAVIPRLKPGSPVTRLHIFDSPQTVLFEGSSIAASTPLDQTLSFLKETQHYWGWIEFAEQTGSKTLAKHLPLQTRRVHSISEPELLKMTPQKAIQRYIRAVKERKISIIVVHPFWFLPSIEGTLTQNLSYFKTLLQALRDNDLTANPSVKWSLFASVRPWQLGVFAAVLSILSSLLTVCYGRKSGVLDMIFPVISAVIVVAASVLGWMTLTQQALLFWVMLIIPTLSVVAALSLSGWKRWSVPFAVLILGIVTVTGITSTPDFYLGIATAVGIKAGFILPLLLVGLFTLTKKEKSIGEILKHIAESQVRLWWILLAGLLVGMVGLYLLRSGNGTSFVSETELLLRSRLDVIFGVRPRTKELIGYSFFCWALMCPALDQKRVWSWLLPVFGTIPFVSVLNSFLHTHTPLLLSLHRSILGLVCGVFVWKISDILWWSWKKIYG